MVLVKYIDMIFAIQIPELDEENLEEPCSSMYMSRETLAIFDKSIFSKVEDMNSMNR
jgi:hypothetical protein